LQNFGETFSLSLKSGIIIEISVESFVARADAEEIRLASTHARGKVILGWRGATTLGIRVLNCCVFYFISRQLHGYADSSSRARSSEFGMQNSWLLWLRGICSFSKERASHFQWLVLYCAMTYFFIYERRNLRSSKYAGTVVL